MTTASDESESPSRAAAPPEETLLDHLRSVQVLTLLFTVAAGVAVGVWTIARAFYDDEADDARERAAQLEASLLEVQKQCAPAASGRGTEATRVGSSMQPPQYLSKVAPSMAPQQWEEISSNSQLTLYGAEDQGIPSPLTWLQREPDATLREIEPPPNAPRALRHLLYYKSVLYSPHDSWSGFFFWWREAPTSFTAQGANSFVIAAFADAPDTLELGFKDAARYEKKIGLQVLPGWHGYVVPFSTFRGIDFNRLELAIIAHSRGQRCADANVFKIAFMGPI